MNIVDQIKPSHDTTLPGWNFINPANPDPIPPANDDDGMYTKIRVLTLLSSLYVRRQNHLVIKTLWNY